MLHGLHYGFTLIFFVLFRPMEMHRLRDEDSEFHAVERQDLGGYPMCARDSGTLQ
jgi:hypothetical protein